MPIVPYAESQRQPIFCHTYIPTQSNKNMVPNPMKMAANNATKSSLYMSLVYLVDVTSYTKNHPVKNNPIPSRRVVR